LSNLTLPGSVASEPFVVSPDPGFVDRRTARNDIRGIERRQFGNSYRNLSEAGRELAEAIDAYKVEHRRRYITTDEMLEVISRLGYRKD
jgi:hypothetical protein